ncbi:MAG: hypothetical protein QOD43_2133 [Gaiellaceae bacterium]|jgi:hypothetical protein|nr:hypothetical protein [Gaiellaceae bacterium]
MVRSSVLRSGLAYGTALGVSSLASYEAAAHILSRVHFISASDDLLGGMWATVATVFVFRDAYQQSSTNAMLRMTATVISFVLCLVYLVFLPFHPWGMALLIGIGAAIAMLAGQKNAVVTTGITTAVVMVVAALSPRDAWQQPILRLGDTAIGVAVGVAAAACLQHATFIERSRRNVAPPSRRPGVTQTVKPAQLRGPSRGPATMRRGR